MYAIGGKSIILNNKILNYFSSISMEMYLDQMVIFRVIQNHIYSMFLGMVGYPLFLFLF